MNHIVLAHGSEEKKKARKQQAKIESDKAAVKLRLERKLSLKNQNQLKQEQQRQQDRLPDQPPPVPTWPTRVPTWPTRVAPEPTRAAPESPRKAFPSRTSRTSRQESQRTVGKSSVRSKGSSSAESEGRAKVIKNCCRKVVEFMFTQVGVGGLVVCYTIVGAVAFQLIETQEEEPSIPKVETERRLLVQNLWNVSLHFNVLNPDRWRSEVEAMLAGHQDQMVGFVSEGYDGRTVHERWTFPAALMFTLSVITMIGYGRLVPRTEWGKITTIIYACFGIPVYILYFMNMGKVFATVLKWVYTKAYRWNVRRKWKKSNSYSQMVGVDGDMNEAFLDELEKQVIVPSTTCLWVMFLYLIVGTIMFAEWEGWNYLDSMYFCVTSLAKIGFGDFVPGAKVDSQGDTMQQIKLVTNFVYLLVGMGVVAMCYYLLKEEVTVKVKQMKQNTKEKIVKLRVKFGI